MQKNSLPLETTPGDIKNRIGAGESLKLIDVREPYERQLAAIEGAEPIPMRTVPANLQEIEAMAGDASVVVFCHHGMRSLRAVNWLREQGVANCQSMAGGIDRWSCEVDPSVRRY